MNESKRIENYITQILTKIKKIYQYLQKYVLYESKPEIFLIIKGSLHQ